MLHVYLALAWGPTQPRSMRYDLTQHSVCYCSPLGDSSHDRHYVMVWLPTAVGGNATWHHRQYDTGGVPRQAECSMAASSSWTDVASQEESLCRYSPLVMP